MTKVERLAVQLRDGMACVYCGTTLEDGASLTVDCVGPDSDDPNHHITACLRCASFRGARPLDQWSEAVAASLNHAISADQIIIRIHDCLRRELPLDRARLVIARRLSRLEAYGKTT